MDRTAGVESLLDRYDGYLHVGSGDDADLYYLTGFDVPDSVVYLYTSDGATLAVSSLEFERARKEARVDDVVDTSRYLSGDRRGDPDARLHLVDGLLEDHGVEDVAVPRGFAVWLADGLRERGYGVDSVEGPVEGARRRKDGSEIGYIRKAQRATEKALAAAEEVLASSETRDDVLYLDGEPLTAERVKTEIEVSLLHGRCHLEDVIVACGPRGADPHWRGEGELRSGEPVIVDVFPRHESRYHADTTRTWVVGEPADGVVEAFEATREAKDAAFDVLSDGAGVTGEEVHDAVCDVFESYGHPTTRDDATEGFVHSTGHGVGLEVHEPPRLSEGGGELSTGDVVTVEPGLYYQDWGGVRVEDLLVVEEEGFENLTEYHERLQL